MVVERIIDNLKDISLLILKTLVQKKDKFFSTFGTEGLFNFFRNDLKCRHIAIIATNKRMSRALRDPLFSAKLFFHTKNNAKTQRLGLNK
jgi:hypothetical protein